jgi:hypothetical protein
MNNQLQIIKTIIDGCIAHGAFKDAESVEKTMDAYRYVAYAVEVFERVGDVPKGKPKLPPYTERVNKQLRRNGAAKPNGKAAVEEKS